MDSPFWGPNLEARRTGSFGIVSGRLPVIPRAFGQNKVKIIENRASEGHFDAIRDKDPLHPYESHRRGCAEGRAGRCLNNTVSRRGARGHLGPKKVNMCRFGDSFGT